MLRQQAFNQAFAQSLKTGCPYCVLEGRNGFKAVKLNSFKAYSIGSVYASNGDTGVVVAIVR